MDKEILIRKIYNDYYLHNVIKKEAINEIKFDKQGFYIFSKINSSKKFKNADDFIKYYAKQFYSDKFSLPIDKQKDSFNIEKAMNSIIYPFIANIDRLKILGSSITKDDAIKIFGISISDIYIITSIIILRVLLYNHHLSEKNMTSNERINFFGTTKPTCWFTAKELQRFNSSIDVEIINDYLKFFSIDLDEISREEDTKKILSYNQKYMVMYLGEFCTFIFNNCEQNIINYFKNENEVNLNLYYKKRGKSFEKYVKGILNILYPKIISNAKYIDVNSRQMELDNLIVEDDLCLNFECKSAGFNIYNTSTDEDTIKQMHRAFGRGFYSIDSFHKTIVANKGIMKLKIDNKNFEYNLSSKNVISYNVTMYPIEFLSTSVHFFDKNSVSDLCTFPITISIVDLYSIILISTINKNIFNYYSKERYYSINKMGKFKIDYDEIDAFGYITDSNLKNGYLDMKKLTATNTNVEQHIMINNCIYREELNDRLAWYGMNVLSELVMDLNVKNIFRKM